MVNKKFEIVLPPSFDSKGKDKIVKDVIKKNKEINSALDKFVKKYVEDVKEEKTEADILIKIFFQKLFVPLIPK